MKRFPAILMITLALSAAGPVPAFANDSIGGLIPSAGMVHTHVKSMRERRFSDVVSQQYDFSCGAAVVTTMFRYAYGAAVDEASVLAGMLRIADPLKVRQRGFSLLDIKNYVDLIGLSAEGYRLSLAQLEDLRIPVIIVLDISGYKHFVVLKRVVGGYAFVADPSTGNRTMRLNDFSESWNGIVLAVTGAGYREDTPLRSVALPLSTQALYGSVAPVIAPDATSTTMFLGVPPVNRL